MTVVCVRPVTLAHRPFRLCWIATMVNALADLITTQPPSIHEYAIDSSWFRHACALQQAFGTRSRVESIVYELQKRLIPTTRESSTQPVFVVACLIPVIIRIASPLYFCDLLEKKPARWRSGSVRNLWSISPSSWTRMLPTTAWETSGNWVLFNSPMYVIQNLSR